MLEEEEEDSEELQTVHVESESYVNFKKDLRKYSTQAKPTGKENVKICRQFNLKKVYLLVVKIEDERKMNNIHEIIFR